MFYSLLLFIHLNAVRLGFIYANQCGFTVLVELSLIEEVAHNDSGVHTVSSRKYNITSKDNNNETFVQPKLICFPNL